MRDPKIYYTNREYKYYHFERWKEPYYCEGCRFAWYNTCIGRCRHGIKNNRTWKKYRKTQYKPVNHGIFI